MTRSKVGLPDGAHRRRKPHHFPRRPVTTKPTSMYPLLPSIDKVRPSCDIGACVPEKAGTAMSPLEAGVSAQPQLVPLRLRTQHGLTHLAFTDLGTPRRQPQAARYARSLCTRPSGSRRCCVAGHRPSPITTKSYLMLRDFASKSHTNIISKLLFYAFLRSSHGP